MTTSSENERLVYEIRRRGWRQGSALTNGADRSVGGDGMGLDKSYTHWILLSHDCDIVHRDFENEPNVEVIGGKLVPTPDGNLFHGKNPRRLQIEINKQWVEFHASTRRFIGRNHLANLDPDNNVDLGTSDARSLASWAARRYVRTALPDSFNRRLQSHEKDIKKLLSREGRDICTVYILLIDDAELPEEKEYKIILVAAMLDRDFDMPARRTAVEKTMETIVSLISKCDNITVDKLYTYAERDISLTDIRSLRRLEFDYLSYSDGNAPPSPRP